MWSTISWFSAWHGAPAAKRNCRSTALPKLHQSNAQLMTLLRLAESHCTKSSKPAGGGSACMLRAPRASARQPSTVHGAVRYPSA